MAGILTNTSAMVALQTLKGVNKGLGMVQNEISTGLKVSNAKDNASVWAIAATMRSDVGGYKQLSDSLATAKAGVGVARTASESVTKLLSEMKAKIVAAQSPSADRAKLQADVAELRNQITSVVSAAQFNGLNLVNGDTADVQVLSSLDRDSVGNVTARNIVVARQDLSTLQTASTSGTATRGGGVNGSTAVSEATDLTLTFVASTPNGSTETIGLNINGVSLSVDVLLNGADAAANALLISTAVSGRINQAVTDGDLANLTATFALGVVTLDAAAGTATQNVEVASLNSGSGGLSGLTDIDVSSSASAAASLSAIEDLITTAIDASAAFGSSQKRIEIQEEFVSNLIDATNTGIGAMVDADLEEASARLQALQVQQQLGTQALSIANQAPQSVLALFR